MIFCNTKLSPPSIFFSLTIGLPLSEQIRKNQYVLRTPEKMVFIWYQCFYQNWSRQSLSPVCKILYRTFRNSFEDKQGEYVKPLLIENLKKFCLVMNFFMLFNGFDLLEMSKIAKKTNNLWIRFSPLMQLCDGGYNCLYLLG